MVVNPHISPVGSGSQPAHDTGTAFRRILIGLIIFTLCLPALLQAKTYRWTDKDGDIHFGESLPPEYAELPYDVINNDGLVIEHVEHFKPGVEPPQATVEQKAKERTPLIPLAERRLQADRFLLIQYQSEVDIQHEQESQLSQLDYDSKLMHQSLDNAITAITSQVRDLADQQRAGKELTPKQQQKIDKLYARLAKEKHRLAKMGEREAGIRARFQADLDRFRYLKSKEGPAEKAPPAQE